MKTTALRFALVTLTLVGLSSMAMAQQNRPRAIQPGGNSQNFQPGGYPQEYVQPGGNGHCVQPDRYVPPTPKLGFRGHMEYGYGMRIDEVFPNSRAEQMGLEPGDVIVRINQTPIRTESDFNSALRNSGNRVRLLVDDVRGSGFVPITFSLYEGPSGIYSSAGGSRPF